MTTFLLVAAAMLLIALAFVVLPLLRSRDEKFMTGVEPVAIEVLRDQQRELDADLARGLLAPEQYQRAVAELEHRVINEAESFGARPTQQGNGHRLVALLAISMPLLAAALYALIGTPSAWTPANLAQGSKPEITTLSAADIDNAIAEARQRIGRDAADVEAWLTLARASVLAQRLDDASVAYEHVTQLKPQEPEPLLEHAELLARQQGNFLGKPTALIEQAMQVAPNYWKSLALAGRAAFDREDYATALKHWEALRDIIPADSKVVAAIEQGMADARARAGSVATSVQSASPARLSGTVSISASLREKVSPEDTVFIFARAVDGPRMPLAVLRRHGRDLPITFTLDDSMAMSPELTLSTATEVVVVARVSKSGDVMAVSGDLEGTSPPIKPPGGDINIEISAMVP